MVNSRTLSLGTLTITFGTFVSEKRILDSEQELRHVEQNKSVLSTDDKLH